MGADRTTTRPADAPRVAAFLRAINVTGRRVTNDRLVDIVAQGGFDHVTAYQAAGNLLLDPGSHDLPAVEATLEHLLETALGYSVEVFVRSADELAATLLALPFSSADVATATGKPQVGFFREAVTDDTAQAVAELSTDTDRVAAIGRELHWLPAEGVGRSPLDMAALADLVGPLTVRTRGTVQRIATKLLAD